MAPSGIGAVTGHRKWNGCKDSYDLIVEAMYIIVVLIGSAGACTLGYIALTYGPLGRWFRGDR